MPTVGVFATIFDEQGHVLCVHQNYPPYLWTTPGGRLKPNESVVDGLVREVREETGYTVEIEGLVGAYSAPFRDDLVLGFEARIICQCNVTIPNSEIAGIGFFPTKSLPVPMKLNTLRRIEDASAGVRGVCRVYIDEAEHGTIIRRLSAA